MRNIFLFVLIAVVCSCSSTKKVRYFNEENVEISKTKFNKIRGTNRYLDVPGDLLHFKKLIYREKSGVIDCRPTVEVLLEKELKQELDSEKPIVVIYYPGKDPCNSSSIATIEMRKNWYDELEDGVWQIAKTKPIYIYKNNEGLKTDNGMIEWQKDPENIIEYLFFEHHYPCSSFVVISTGGEFISYFGEFGKDRVWNAVKALSNN